MQNVPFTLDAEGASSLHPVVSRRELEARVARTKTSGLVGAGGVRPYYDAEGVTLYHGDCLELLPLLRADVAITDPPYNVGLDYSNGDKRTDYKEWCAAWFGMLRAMTKAVALTPGTVNVGLWYQIENPAWMLAWHKPACMGNSPFGVCNFEPILFWGKARRNSGCDVVTAPVVPDKSAQGHPCPKPVMWAKKLMVLMAEETEIVIDPFCGSGTTLIAAKQLNRCAIGIEREERFCEMAAKRLSQGMLSLGGGGAEHGDENRGTKSAAQTANDQAER